MPRPQKKRRIEGLPQYNEFSPEDSSENDAVVLSLDEYETIRLIDACGMKQEECARQMQIARTSVTAIYDSARHKIADAIVNGRKLYITGGNCSMPARHCCGRHTGYSGQVPAEKKGEHEMRLAVTYENGQVFQHFGRTPAFKIYDVKDGNILESIVLHNNGTGHGALAGVLAAAQVDALICGGMGMGALYALQDAGIKVYAGVSGDADEAVKALMNGSLEYTEDANCDHHDEGEGCGCGEHEAGGCGCGSEEESCECGSEEESGCCCGGHGEGSCGCH